MLSLLLQPCLASFAVSVPWQIFSPCGGSEVQPPDAACCLLSFSGCLVLSHLSPSGPLQGTHSPPNPASEFVRWKWVTARGEGGLVLNGSADKEWQGQANRELEGGCWIWMMVLFGGEGGYDAHRTKKVKKDGQMDRQRGRSTNLAMGSGCMSLLIWILQNLSDWLVFPLSDQEMVASSLSSDWLWMVLSNLWNPINIFSSFYCSKEE